MEAQQRKRGFWGSIRPAFGEMKRNDPLRMAGATAFFTSFALPPILIILFQLFTLFLSRKLVGTEMTEALTNTFGKEGANQIRVTTRGFRTIAQNWWIAGAGFVFLVFVATTLFTVVKNTLNDIWKIKAKEGSGFLQSLKLRGRSLLVILLAGILFLASLALDGVKVVAGKYVKSVLVDDSNLFTGIVNEVISIIVVSAWFILLFRYLADGRPSWKISAIGGMLTGILFWTGKILLSFLMSHSNIKSIYGASGSLVLLLLFVFYSSFILYYGASFIKVYAANLGEEIAPVTHAYHYQLSEISEPLI